MIRPTTAGRGICKVDRFLRRKHFHGFRHKTDAAHDNGISLHLGGPLAQTEGITDVIRNLPNILSLIGMSKDTDLLLYLTK